jgi:hypothetical protein
MLNNYCISTESCDNVNQWSAIFVSWLWRYSTQPHGFWQGNMFPSLIFLPATLKAWQFKLVIHGADDTTNMLQASNEIKHYAHAHTHTHTHTHIQHSNLWQQPVDLETLKDLPCIWENMMIPFDITLTCKAKAVFRKFLSMRMKNYHLNQDQEFFFLELLSEILDSQTPTEYACYWLQKSCKCN